MRLKGKRNEIMRINRFCCRAVIRFACDSFRFSHACRWPLGDSFFFFFCFFTLNFAFRFLWPMGSHREYIIFRFHSGLLNNDTYAKYLLLLARLISTICAREKKQQSYLNNRIQWHATVLFFLPIFVLTQSLSK